MLDGLATRTMASAAKGVGGLVELGLMEQRYKAVLEVLDGGVSVTETARRYSVCRQTVHTWLRRYADEGLPGLVDRAAHPGTYPHQMPQEVEARVVGMRRQHPGWQPRTILRRLIRTGVTHYPRAHTPATCSE